MADPEWEEKMERLTDTMVELVVDEMKKGAKELFPSTDPEQLPRGIVLASIAWTTLEQKLLKRLDDIRHEHLLAMRQCTGA